MNRGRYFHKKIAKKFKKLKNHFSALFLAKTGVDRPKSREKKILPRFPFVLGLGKKIPKKIAKRFKKLKKKTYFQHYFQPKQDEIRREREKKNYSPEFRS